MDCGRREHPSRNDRIGGIPNVHEGSKGKSDEDHVFHAVHPRSPRCVRMTPPAFLTSRQNEAKTFIVPRATIAVPSTSINNRNFVSRSSFKIASRSPTRPGGWYQLPVPANTPGLFIAPVHRAQIFRMANTRGRLKVTLPDNFGGCVRGC